jgi:hypothetical protein
MPKHRRSRRVAQKPPLVRGGHRDALRSLFEDGGLAGTSTAAIEIPTVFRDFDDYWAPFLGGQGPAPTCVASLTESGRTELRERLRDGLSPEPDGSIALTARAWAARETVPG